MLAVVVDKLYAFGQMIFNSAWGNLQQIGDFIVIETFNPVHSKNKLAFFRKFSNQFVQVSKLRRFFNRKFMRLRLIGNFGKFL